MKNTSYKKRNNRKYFLNVILIEQGLSILCNKENKLIKNKL